MMKSSDGMIDIGDTGSLPCGHREDRLIYKCGVCNEEQHTELTRLKAAVFGDEVREKVLTSWRVSHNVTTCALIGYSLREFQRAIKEREGKK